MTASGTGATRASQREADAYVSPKDQGSRQEGYVDPRYAGVKKKVATESRRHKESVSFDDDAPRPIDLKTLYKQPERSQGWKNSGVYSPPVVRQQESTDLIIKEF